MDQAPVRIDKWLWAARLVKTRALAVDAIRGGRVRLNGQTAKPSKDVRPGDTIEFSQGVIRLEATVRGTAERRLPAADAQLLYAETEESRVERERRLAEMRMTRPQGVDRNARPTKRERRQLERVKGRRER
ncbi:MAG TPA: RNA-binding S4 domain-containing protein [Solirubrobacter sp.]|nr:RNA-binding S4 domain-containing protein [Solirubrobacter sp.]